MERIERVNRKRGFWTSVGTFLLKIIAKYQWHRSSALTSKDISKGTVQELTNVLAERILNLYGDGILRLSYSYVHNMFDAEEILGDVVMKYLQARPEFKDDAHEKAWLLKVTANLSKNRIAYNKVRETDELSDTLEAQHREDLSFVWEAVKQLPQKYRAAIHLFYYEGYATADIARILSRKESSVRSDLRRGRERLKLILKEEYDFE